MKYTSYLLRFLFVEILPITFCSEIRNYVYVVIQKSKKLVYENPLEKGLSVPSR